MDYLTYLEFNDIIGRFKWYPDAFSLTIFCKDKKSLETFKNEIEKQNIEWINKNLGKNSFRFYKKYQTINGILMEDNIRYVGGRANAVFFDTEFSIRDFYELIRPLANVYPMCGCYGYDSHELEKMFELKGRHTACEEFENLYYGV